MFMSAIYYVDAERKLSMARERCEEELIEKLPIEIQEKAWKDLMEARDKRRLEAIEECRHHKLCDAIKEAGRESRKSARPGLWWLLFLN